MYFTFKTKHAALHVLKAILNAPFNHESLSLKKTLEVEADFENLLKDIMGDYTSLCYAEDRAKEEKVGVETPPSSGDEPQF